MSSPAGCCKGTGGYAANGNVVSMTDSVMGTWNFTYDDLNRLATSAGSEAGNPFPNECWSYDAFGNWTMQMAASVPFAAGTGGGAACQTTGSLGSTFWAHYNARNQMTQTGLNTNQGAGYDAAGDIAYDGNHSYGYDAEGRICAMQSGTVDGIPLMTGYVYDADGNRVAKGTITQWSCDPTSNGLMVSGSETDYTIDQDGHQATEVAEDANGNMQWAHTNVWSAEGLIATYDAAPNNTAALHFYTDDWLETRRAQTDYAGVWEQDCSSLPYGDQLTCTASVQQPTEHHFTGKERDAESGNDYFGKRYYASSMGRWLSPDVVNVTEERMLNPANTLNKYAYGANNPLKFIDPDGQDVTYFYDPGGIAGHAVLFAYNQQNGDSAIESFGPGEHAPVWGGKSDFDMDEFQSVQGLRDNYASITIQTTPEIAQEVINYIRQNPDPSVWTMAGPNCSSECAKILHKFKLDNQSKWDFRQGMTPKILWHSLLSRYNPSQNQWGATPTRGRDYGNPRFDMFQLFWNQIEQGQKATVTVQQGSGLADPCTATPKPAGCS